MSPTGPMPPTNGVLNVWFEPKPHGPRHASSKRVVTVGKRLTVPVILALAALTVGAGIAPHSGSTPKASAELSAAALDKCGAKPDAQNTGATGQLVSRSETKVSRSGQRVEAAHYPNSIIVSGDSARLSDVKVDGSILILGEGVALDHVTAQSVVVSGASNVNVSNSNLSGGSSAVQVTSDRGPVTNVSLGHNYIHDLAVPNDSHSGTHVRGASGLTISCSNYDLGAYGNAAVFLQDANGGTKDVTIEDNWLSGGGFTLASDASEVRVANNVFEGGYRWALCRNSSEEPLTASGNTLANGSSVIPCNGATASSASSTTSPTTKATTSTSSTTTAPSSSTTKSSSTTTRPPSSTTTRATSSTTTTTSVTSPPAASPGCAFKPSASTTGAKGSLPASSVTTLGDGQSLQNVTVDHLLVSGSDVTVRNVKVNGTVGIIGDRVLVDHVSAEGLSISSASHVTVQYTNTGFGQSDGLNVTSDRGRLASDITLRYNYAHDPRVSSAAHYDGIQVRGVDGLSITCSVFDAGPYKPMYNAGIYLEDANGGDSNITGAHNRVYGSGGSIMMDARNTTLDSNRIGGDIHWGTCRLGDRTGNPGLRSVGNVWDATGAALPLCTKG
jgi:hypothetical protein